MSAPNKWQSNEVGEEGENPGHIGSDAPQITTNALRRKKLRPISEDDRVIAIVAPSGYGKTTLALQWLLETRKDVAAGWIHVDENCRDPVVFVDRLGEALGTGGPRDGNAFCGTEDLEAAIDSWVSGVRARRRRHVLFVDDAHVLEGSGAMRCLHLLIRCMPRNLVLVVTSRGAEGLGLAAAALRGEVRWITLPQLTLSQEEIAALAKENGLALDLSEVEAIAELTEGWPALTQLALCSMGAGGGGRFARESYLGVPVASYIHDQFLATLSGQERRIVSVMAIVGEGTQQLLESLTSVVISDELGRFEQMGAVRRHARRGKPVLWVMHPMIREGIVAREQPHANWSRSIQRRAASWWWSHDEPERAIRLGIATEMCAEVQYWLCRYSPVLIHREGRHETFLQLLSAAERLWGRPDLELSSWAVSALMFLRRYGEAERLLLELSKVQVASEGRGGELGGCRTDPADLQRAVIAGLCDDYIAAGIFARNWISQGAGDPFYQGMAWIAIAFSQKCQCQFSEAKLSLDKARTLMQQVESAYGIAWARVVGIVSLLKEGRFREVVAETAVAEVELQDGRSGVTDLVALMKATSALASYERGDLDQCQAALEIAMPCLHRQGIVDAMIAGYVAAARLQVARGRLSAGLDVLAEGQRVGMDRGLSRLSITMEFERAMLLAKHGAGHKDHGPGDAPKPHPASAMEGLMRDKSARLSVRLALANNRPEMAGEALAGALARARESGQRYKLAELLVFDSLCLFARGKIPAASSSLAESLEIGLSEGYFRLYVDEGEAVAKILRLLAKSVAVSPPVATLIRHILEAQSTGFAQPIIQGQTPLSEREKEILALVDGGLSNREISQRLFLTEGTVKWHLHNLYNKLDVRSRTSALHAAKSAGLLS